MKKILYLSLILLITMGIMSNVYAAPACNMSAKTSKDVFDKEEVFTIDFVVSDIQSERGIIAIGATLEYDKDSLTLVKMEGQNDWETPVNGISYNEANGEMAINKGGLGKSDETFLRITFKVNKESKQNPTISLSNIKVGDGTTPATVNTVNKTITVNGGITSNPSQNTNKTPSTSGDNSVKNEKLPQTGINNTVLEICIGLVALVTLMSYIRIKTLNK